MDHPFRGQGPLFLLLASYLAGVLGGLAAGDAWTGLAGLGALCAALAVFFRRSGGTGTACLAAAVCGILVAGRLPLARPGEVRPWLDNEVVLRATVREVRVTDAGWTALAENAVVSRPGETGGVRLARVRLSVRGAAADVPFPAEVRAAGRLHPMRSAGNPGEFPAEFAAMSLGIQYRFSSEASKAVFIPGAGTSGTCDAYFLRARERASRWLHRQGGETDGALLLRSLATGEVPPPSHPLTVLLRRTGLAHLLAISGINVGIFFILHAAAARCIVWFFAMRRGSPDLTRASALLSLPACWAYVLLAGAPLPAVRSAGMITLGTLLYVARGVRGAGWTWSACFCLTAAADPFVLLSPSFLLSYGATFYLIAAAGPGVRPRDDRAQDRVRDRLASAARASLAAFAGTLPVSCLFFRAIPTGAVLWNVAFGPILGGVGVAGAAAAVVGGAFSFDALGVPVRWAVLLLDKALFLLDAASGSGRGCVDVPPAGVAATASFVLLAAASAVQCLRRGRSPLPSTVAAGALFVAWIHHPYLALPPRDLRLEALNVGRGAAHVVSLPGGATIVVDAGSALHGDAGHRVVVPALRRLGVRTVDVLVLTHPHEDHYGGAAAVLEELRVGEIWIPAGTSPSDFGPAVESAKATVRKAAAGDGLAAGAASVRVRGPSRAPAFRRPNDAGIVLEVRHGPLSVWLPGDVESGPAAWGPANGPEPRTTVLFLPHHGSARANPAAWVAAARPALAVSQRAPQDIDCYGNGNLLPSCRWICLENGAFSVKSDGRDVAWGQPRLPGFLARLWRVE